MMKKIIKFLLETDKQLHILACFAIAIVAAGVFKLFGHIPVEAAGLAWIVAFLCGLAKEIWDEAKSESSDKRDWIADIIGMTAGALQAWLMM